MKKFFYGSHALMELYLGSPAYRLYFSGDLEVVTLNLCVSEVYGKLLSRNDPSGAEKVADAFMQDALIPSNDALLLAQKEKILLRKRTRKSISLTDARGYLTARSLKLKFLTGDDAFRGLKNVEFVK